MTDLSAVFQMGFPECFFTADLTFLESTMSIYLIYLESKIHSAPLKVAIYKWFWHI